MQHTIKIIERTNFYTLRNVLMGATLCYAVETKNYTHLPIIVIFPSIYAGYQAYSNREVLIKSFKSNLLELKKNLKR
jgi:hypothetical protein